MSISKFVAVAAAFVAIAPPASAQGWPYGHRCTTAGASGKSWRQFSAIDQIRPGFYEAIATCPKGYRPMSGHLRYEGAWNEPEMLKQWREVLGTAYDETASQEADSWACVVRWNGKDPPRPPEPLWCTAVCCRFE